MNLGAESRGAETGGSKRSGGEGRAETGGTSVMVWRHFGADFCGERGQALVEFALTAGMVILLVLGALSFGLAIHARNVVAVAAGEGARLAACNAPDPLVRQKVEEVIEGYGLPKRYGLLVCFDKDSDVTVERYPPGNPKYAKVTVAYRQPTFVPWLFRLVDPGAGSLGEAFALQAAAVYRIER